MSKADADIPFLHRISEFHFIQQQVREMEQMRNIRELLNNGGNYSEQSEALPRAGDLEITLASISPLLGTKRNPISEECKNQSIYYLSELFSNQSWAKKSKTYN